MKTKKLLVLSLTLILLATLCLNIFAADKKDKSLKEIDKGVGGGVVIQRYSGSW